MERKQKFRVVLYIIIAAVIAAAVIFAAAGSGMDSTSVLNEKLELGQKYLVELDYSNAVLEFTDAINIDPKNPDAYIGLAEAYIGTGDTEKAIETLESGYEETGDERIKKMLDELTGGSDTENDQAKATESAVVPVDMESIYIPYKVNGELMSDEALYGGISYELGNKTVSIKNNDESVSNDVCISYWDDIVMINIDALSSGEYFIENIASSSHERRSDYHFPIFEAEFPNLDNKYFIGSPYVPAYKVFDENNALLYESAFQNDNIYDKDGRVIQNGYYKFEYNKNGNLIKRTADDNSFIEYEYDEKGNLINWTTDDNSCMQYKYDEKGNLIKTIYNAEDTISIIEYDLHGNEVFSECSIALSNSFSTDYDEYKYEYNENGNIIEAKSNYKDKGINSQELDNRTQIRKYDSNNNVVYVKTNIYGTREINSETIISDYTIEYINEYDSNNNLIKCTTSTVYNDGKYDNSIYTTVYTYDSHGNVEMSETYDADNKLIYSNEYEYLRLELPKYVLDEFREAAGSRK